MTYKPDENVSYIVIHYSATPVEMDVTSDDIDTMHKRRGFKEIGYHWYIRKNGSIEMGRDMSEPGRFEVGAHSKGENSVSVGICYEGGVTKAKPDLGFDSRTPAQKKAMIELIGNMLDRFPGAVVKGHRDMPGAATQCPGFNVTEWWDEVRRKQAQPKSPAKSTTLQAAAGTAVAGGTATVTALSKLDPTAQYIVLGCAAFGALCLLWIAKERIRKWANGDR